MWRAPRNSAACVHFTLEMIYIPLDGIKDLKMPGCCYDSVRPCVELAGILVPTDSFQYDLSPLLCSCIRTFSSCVRCRPQFWMCLPQRLFTLSGFSRRQLRVEINVRFECGSTASVTANFPAVGLCSLLFSFPLSERYRIRSTMNMVKTWVIVRHVKY